MKQLILLISISVIFSYTELFSQVDTIAEFDQKVLDMQTFEDKLFICGNFSKVNGSICWWSANYDGNTIIRHTKNIGGGGLDKMEIFNDSLYAVGSLLHGFSTGVSKWDGSTWINAGSTNTGHDMIYRDGEDLYVATGSGYVRKKTLTGNFEPFFTFPSNSSINSIIRFKDKLIFAGRINSFEDIAVNNIVQWDGTKWEPLGKGVNGTIYTMEVFNNELYIAGNFNKSGDKSVNKIAKWNGSDWIEVGLGMTGTSLNGIRDMIVYNNALYIIGDFDKIGGISSENFAKWNGNNWIAIGLKHDDGFLSCIEIYKNKLYIGSFDFEHAHLYEYDLSTGIEELAKISFLNLYPNPANNVFNISYSSEKNVGIDIEIIDLNGIIIKKISCGNVMNLNMGIDCNNLNTGTYLIILRDNITHKIIKKEKIILL